MGWPKGVVPKILAATTNGIFTNQLLGITFGTLGCRQGEQLQHKLLLSQMKMQKL